MGWGHKWLIAGALGASLVYSGQAAIHACLLAWSHHAYGENDVWALASILSTSAILAVPLLNWSKSIRDLGMVKGDDDSEKNDFSKARTIIVYWGFLIITGLFSVMALAEDRNPKALGYYSLLQSLGGETISCVISGPPAQFDSLNFTALAIKNTVQQNGTIITFPTVDAKWADMHGCSTPCTALASKLGSAIFRSASDYQLATREQIDVIYSVPGKVTNSELLASWFQTIILKFSLFVIPYVILQGIFAATFGRRSPTQTRDAL